MNPYLIYAKVGAALAAVALLFGTGWHFGGASTRDASDKAHAVQMTTVVSALEKRQADAETELTRRQGIIDAYDNHKNDPPPAAAAGLAQRVYRYTAGPGCSPVSSAATVASGAIAPATVPGGNPSAERLSGLNQVSRLTQAIFDASDDDAAQMNAMIKLATPPPTP